jgi:hypothetical protein
VKFLDFKLKQNYTVLNTLLKIQQWPKDIAKGIFAYVHKNENILAEWASIYFGVSGHNCNISIRLNLFPHWIICTTISHKFPCLKGKSREVKQRRYIIFSSAAFN